MEGLHKSFLQTEMWAEFQRSLGRKVFEVEGVKVIRHDLPFGKNYLYVPYPFSVPDLHNLAMQENSIFVKVEPMQDDIARGLMHRGYQKSQKNIQPHKTVVLDLTRSEDELLSAMHHKTRYNIRVAEKHGIVVRESSEIEIFWNLLKKTTERDRFNSHEKEYYQKLLQLPNTSLWIAQYQNTSLAASIVLQDRSNAYYLHGASDHSYRHLMAPYALHWEIAKNYKLKTISSYDFWGIDSVRWPGVTRFKLGWGGRTVEYPGAFDLVISSFWTTLYNLKNSVR